MGAEPRPTLSSPTCPPVPPDGPTLSPGAVLSDGGAPAAAPPAPHALPPGMSHVCPVEHQHPGLAR